MKVEARVHVLQVASGNIANSAEAVPQGAAMDIECLRCMIVITAGIKIPRQGFDQFGIFLAVVCHEGTKPLRQESTNLGPAIAWVEDSAHAEVVETPHAVLARC